MAGLHDQVAAFIKLVIEGKTLEAIARFYDPDVCVFENRELARSGRDQALAYEREQLSAQSAPAHIRVKRWAADEPSGVAFLELVLRFSTPGGRPMRLEEVAVQRWAGGKIVEERFYYEGLVDEGD